MKKLLFTLAAVAICFSAAAQTYHPKTVKLVPVGDGTYRIVKEDESRETELAERAEAARWAGVLQEPKEEISAPNMREDIVKEAAPLPEKPSLKRKDRSYLSIGAAGMNTTLRLTEESADFWQMGEKFEDTQFGLKGAFGAWMSEYVRAELFFQWRGEISISGSQRNIAYSAKAKMWDIGANAFLYANPQSNVRFFIGAGIAATRVQPSMTLNGIDINVAKLVIGGKTYRFDLFESQFFATPSGFAGVEFAVGENADMDVMLFYSQTNVHKDGIDIIKSFGLSSNIRFNLKRKVIKGTHE